MEKDNAVTILLMSAFAMLAFIMGVATVQGVPVFTLTVEAVQYFAN